MKKLMIVVGVVLFVIAGCAEDQVAKDQGMIVLKQKYMEPGTDEPFSGERVVDNEALNLRAEATYVDGYPEMITYYYPNQQKKTTIVVGDQGKGEVISQTEWYQNGQKKFEHRDRTLREWHENGQLKAEVPYDKNGDLNGIIKKWDADGELEGEEEYDHGTLVENPDS